MQFVVTDGDGWDEWGECTLDQQQQLTSSIAAIISFNARYKTFIKKYAVCFFQNDVGLNLATGESTRTKSCFKFDDLAEAEAFLERSKGPDPDLSQPSSWFEFKRIG